MGTWIIVIGAVALNLWLGYAYVQHTLPYKIQQSKEKYKKRWRNLDWNDHGKEDMVYWVTLTVLFPWFMIPYELFSKQTRKMIEDTDD